MDYLWCPTMSSWHGHGQIYFYLCVKYKLALPRIPYGIYKCLDRGAYCEIWGCHKGDIGDMTEQSLLQSEKLSEEEEDADI